MTIATRCLVLAVTLLAAACAGEPDASECITGITCPAGTKCAAAQAVCITNDCGDSIVQSTEACDDGNIVDGDGCAANCQSREQCGDNVLNAAAGELCDDGNAVGGDGCAADCKSVEVCGNGVRDVQEACDDGNTVPGDGCSGNCKSTEICGNKIVDLGEKCDDGDDPGGCNPDCQGGTGCGDGAIDIDGSGNALEECDDGNGDNQDDCTDTCNLNTCGDGIVQLSGARVEQCDPSINFGETAGCNLDCTTTACGDGKINNEAGEECDFGSDSNGVSLNADSKDCTATCHVNVCGDTAVNMTLRTVNGVDVPTEDCDDGNNIQTDGCSNECTEHECGNGIREDMEACDDANLTNGDGCSSLCVSERCGDGLINDGEQCDGTGTASVVGTPGETATCNIDCTKSTPMCGDGKINKAAGEQCDDQNTADSGDACRNNCKLNVCGDNSKSATELCDDGNADNGDGCTTSCTTQTCGNGIRETSMTVTEQCDDGNQSDLDGCLTTCVYATCGDGKVRTGVEQCDAGTANNGADKDCLSTCKINVCGDGFRDQEGTGASETDACDDGNTDTETACPYGVASCTRCDANCNNVLTLTGNTCGDGTQVSPETCDDGNRTTETSCAYGTPTCNVCSDDCTTQSAETGPFCGDGTKQSSNEVCDDKSPTQTCGTCNNACSVAFAAAAATGIIIASDNAGGNIGDGDTFTLNDGLTSVTFEFDKNAASTAGNVAIDASGSLTATQIRDRVAAAILLAKTTKNLRINTTDAGSSGLVLTNGRQTALGNKAITRSGFGGGSTFYTSPTMSGGSAGDCLAGTPCVTDDDCAPATALIGAGVCSGTPKVCQ